MRESVFEEAFENLDEDKDGKITKQEFINYYKRTGVAMWYVVRVCGVWYKCAVSSIRLPL